MDLAGRSMATGAGASTRSLVLHRLPLRLREQEHSHYPAVHGDHLDKRVPVASWAVVRPHNLHALDAPLALGTANAS